MIPNGDLLAAEFLPDGSQYTEARWIGTYAPYVGICKPELMPEQAVDVARQAFAREGELNNPMIAAGCDAEFGPSVLCGEVFNAQG
jgi:hypothetical protein